MGSVQSKIRRVFKKKFKKSRDNDSRTNLPQGPPLIYEPNEPNQAHVNPIYQATHSQTNLPQGPPPVFIPDQPNPALDSLQQQVNTTYQDTGVVLRESQILSEATDIPDNVSSSLKLPSPPIRAAISATAEDDGEDLQPENETTGVSVCGVPTNTQREVGKIELQDLVSSNKVKDTEKTRISRLWGEAIEKLNQKDKIRIQLDSEEDAYSGKPVQRLLEDVKINRAKIEKQRIRYKNSEGEDVAVADTIFRELNKYASVGDTALQHHPDVVALVWSGFKLLLQVGTSYVDNLAMILSSLGYLAWIICCGALYEDLYLEIDSELSQELRGCLVAQYVSILTYLSYANEHLQRDKTERIFESLSPRLSRLLDSIRESEKTINEHADKVEKKEQNASRRELADNLKHIREQLENVKTAVNECHEKLSQLCHFIDKTIFDNTLDWVCDIQYGKIHEEHREKRTADTCIWLENNRIFQEWVNCRSLSAVLWLRGAAGTGKTILASSIIDLLNDKYKMKRSLAYFYCSITSPDRITPESVLRAITKQLCHAYSGEKLPKKLMEIKDRRIRQSAGLLSLEESTDLIIELSNYLSLGVWIVIDALDECADGRTRKTLFTSLDKIVTGGKDIRIFLTGRDEADIRDYMMRRHGSYLIDPSDNASDIELYIKDELRKLYEDIGSRESGSELVTQIKNLEEENIKSLKENANGMFLSVHHRMEAMRNETTLHGMQMAIKDFPSSMNTVYTDILDRINRQGNTDSTSAHDILKWLFYAVDDFSADTILEALRHTASLKESGNSKPKARTVRNAQNICCGLVTHDEKTGVLRFSHATVKEYLEGHNGATSFLHGGHEFMSDICLRILAASGDRVGGECADDTSIQAFISYASRNWGNHVRHCESRDSCRDFLKPSSSSYKAWSSKAAETIPTLRMKGPTESCVDLVWVACYYRLPGTFKTNLETIGAGCANAAGRTPLHHCAENGYLEFVEYLLKHKDIAVDAQDDMRRSPLLLAIISNQGDVVEALLEHPGLTIDMVDQDGRTALIHASLVGSDKIVQLLLESSKSLDVNVGDTEGYTALHHATLKGNESILDLLLRVSSLNINSQSRDGNTALSLAAQSDSNIAVVEKLLSFQVSSGPALNPNLTNNQSETPLWIAAEHDQQKIAERLIEDKRVDINCGLGGWDNMFIKAADSNKAWLVKLLVAREDLDINRRGYRGWTALCNAIRYNALEAFKYIIAVPRVDIECNDDDGDTLLHVAIEKDRTDMVSELLAHGANANATNQKGQTPLIAAAKRGNFDVFRVLLAHYDKGQPQDRVTQLLGAAESDDVRIMQLILDRRGYNINQRNESGKTELMIAAANGLTDAVQTLLKKDAIDVNAVDNEGESALSLAILKGHNSVIDALVGCPDIEIKLPAHCGTTLPQWVFECTNDKILDVILKSYPTLETVKAVDGKRFISLISAAAFNDIRIMQYLLAHHGYSLNNTNGVGRTALIEAAVSGHKEAVTILLREKSIDINLVDSEGRSPLLCAAENGHTEIVQTLLKMDRIDINLVDSYGNSALILAARNGHSQVVQALLENKEIDIHLVGSEGRSPLLSAAENGHTEIVQTLLKMDGIDINLVDSYGNSALILAAKNGHSQVVQALLENKEIDINQVDSKGKSALILAAEKEHTEVVQVLLEKEEIKVNLVDSEKNSALSLASKLGYTEIAKALLKHPQIDIRCGGWNDSTPLLTAALYGQYEIFQSLFKRYATDQLQEIDVDGDTTLGCAAYSGNIRIMQLVLDSGEYNINHQATTHGYTALIWAVVNQNKDAVETLLKVDGVDVGILDNEGRSALDIAKSRGNTEIIALLEARIGQKAE